MVNVRESNQQSIYILGAGRCGRALAHALEAAGHSIVGCWNATAAGAAETRRQFPSVPVEHVEKVSSFREADVVWVAVPDRFIVDVAPWLSGVPIAFHASGAIPAERLKTRNGAQFVSAVHPLQSFPVHAVGAEHLGGVYFGIEGDDEAAVAAMQLILDIGGVPFRVSTEEEKALYHAACCVASNAFVVLFERAVRLFIASGSSRAEAVRALLPLVHGTIQNLEQTEFPLRALTGPVARGDTEVVSTHLVAIQQVVPEEMDSYRMVTELIAAILQTK